MANLNEGKNEYVVDVRQLNTVKVVETVKEVVVPKIVEKEVEVEKVKYRDVVVERPKFEDLVVKVEKVKVEDVTKAIVGAIEKAVDEAVKKAIEKVTIKIDGSGDVKLKVEV